jgi:hypothetical protein
MRPGLIRYLVGLSLALSLLMLSGGCGQQEVTVETAEVAGKVLYNGRPLPGGQVTFTTKDLKFTQTATISPKGEYKIMAPVGEVMIAVNNAMLSPQTKSGPILKRPGAEPPKRPKGTYVEIPSEYYFPEASGLRYTVAQGAQTHDIELHSKKKTGK